MSHVRLLLALCLGCSLAHCQRRSSPHESKPSAPHESKPQPVAEPSFDAPAASATDCSTAVEPLSERTLKGVVQGWQRAQQQADLASYAGFYGPRFSGLFRASSGLRRLNRSTWLAQEKATFSLGARGDGAPLIALGAGGAQVVVGGQELFLVAGPTGPKIIWQAPTLPIPVPLQAEPGIWLAEEEGALLSATPNANWATGAPTLFGTERARRSVLIARLPKALQAWLGRRVRVLGASGAMCETRLQRFALWARITPERRAAEHWEGCAEGPPIAPELIAADIWRLSASGGQGLVAEFSAPCKGALLAIDPDGAVPEIAAPQPASSELGTRLLDGFRGLPEYARIQARYRLEQPSAEGSWDDHDARRNVSVLELPGRPPLYFVSVEVGACCEGFSAGLSALWPNGIEVPPQALSALDPARLTPSARVVFQGSAEVVLLGPDGLFRARSLLRREPGRESFLRELSSAVPFFAGEG